MNIREFRTDPVVSAAIISYGGVGGVETMTESSEDDPTLSRGSERRLPELFALDNRLDK